jgi:hypothetical protein
MQPREPTPPLRVRPPPPLSSKLDLLLPSVTRFVDFTKKKFFLKSVEELEEEAQRMGCGASSANNGRVAEPQRLAPGPSSATGEAAPPSGSGIHVLAQASSPPRPAVGSAQRPQACSPLSAARLSGAATPVLGASYKSNFSTELEDQLVDVEGEEDYQVRTHSTKCSLNGESRLLKFEEPSLQARVDQLQNHVQTQIFGKTSSALRMPLLGADDEDEEEEDEEMNELYDMPPSSELDASWRSKIFSYDGTDVPDAILSKIMLDTRWAKEVQIKSCKVGLEEVNFLDKLVQDRELRALTLARCNLEDDVAVELARCLGSGGWKSIHTLGFDGNQMVGDAAAEALAQALLTNTTLHGENPLRLELLHLCLLHMCHMGQIGSPMG